MAVKQRFRAIIANFPHPRVFKTSLKGLPMEFCNGGVAQKLE